ncbi:MAG: rod shape-determining protein MreD [Rhodospirillales bacterium]
MKPSLWYRMDVIARRLTPFGLTLTLVLASILPLHIPGYARVVPALPLIAVYFWAVYRPNLLPAYAVFLIGLLHDSLSGTPIGMNAVILLVVYGAVISQRRFLVGKPFVIVWMGFVLVAGGAELAGWSMISIFNVTISEPRAALVQYLLTLGFFPFLSWFFLRWIRIFLEM